MSSLYTFLDENRNMPHGMYVQGISVMGISVKGRSIQGISVSGHMVPFTSPMFKSIRTSCTGISFGHKLSNFCLQKRRGVWTNVPF